jgi:hypothetical protein
VGVDIKVCKEMKKKTIDPESAQSALLWLVTSFTKIGMVK